VNDLLRGGTDRPVAFVNEDQLFIDHRGRPVGEGIVDGIQLNAEAISASE
jgi:hypothetical protein